VIEEEIISVIDDVKFYALYIERNIDNGSGMFFLLPMMVLIGSKFAGKMDIRSL